MTHGKPPDLEEALELSLRARRGELGADAQRALDHALEASALVRAAHEAGRSFDAAGAVRPGDEALILRAAGAALSQREVPWRRFGTRWSLGVAAAVLVASAAAATGVVVSRERRSLELHRAPPTVTVQPRSVPRAGSGSAGPRSEQTTSPVSPAASDGATASPPSPPSAGASTQRSDKTASSLFRDASAARRAGDFATARTLYVELQARFPSTNEARVSQVSLGKLLLSTGKPREAERAFAAYLRGGAGDLGEEALVGRASALAALGQANEERRAWQELTRKYPTSIYRARAETRIGALDAAERALLP
jgi:TolA-binding protein